MRVFNDLTIRMPKVPTAVVGKALTRERTAPLHRETQVDIPHGLVPIRVVAPIALRKAVYSCALFFRREFGYDFVQYAIREDDWHSRAFLWISDPDYTNKHNVWGACCFRWREYKDADPLWAMQWVWLHPYARNHGLVTRTWSYFLRGSAGLMWSRPIARRCGMPYVRLGGHVHLYGERATNPRSARERKIRHE
jgi:hypothetical protein